MSDTNQQQKHDYEAIGRRLEAVDPDLFATLAGDQPAHDYASRAVKEATETVGALREAALHGDLGKTDGDDLATALWSVEHGLIRASNVQALGLIRRGEGAEASA